MYPQNVRIGRLLFKIRVLQAIASISQTQPRGVRAKLVNRLSERQEVALALGHLLPVKHQVSIRPHAQRPLVLGHDRNMVVQRHCQMVRHEVLCGRADIEWIKVIVFVLEDIEFLFWYGRVRGEGPLAEDIFPDFVSHLLWRDPQWSWFAAIQVIDC